MKISFTSFTCPDWDIEQIITTAVKHGYHGIEFRIDAGHQHGVETTSSSAQRMEIRDRLQSSGIEPCCLATGIQIIHNNSLSQLPSRIELAAEIGCTGLRVLGGRTTEDIGIDQLIEQAAELLNRAAEIASQSGIELWLETHDNFSRGAHAAAVVRAARHPAIGISYNNIHPIRHGEPLDLTVAAISGLIRHTHFHDGMNNQEQVIITPMGAGQMPIDDTFLALIQIGFDGYLSGEWFHNQYGNEPDDSLAQYHREINKLARKHFMTLGI